MSRDAGPYDIREDIEAICDDLEGDVVRLAHEAGGTVEGCEFDLKGEATGRIYPEDLGGGTVVTSFNGRSMAGLESHQSNLSDEVSLDIMNEHQVQVKGRQRGNSVFLQVEDELDWR